MAKLGTTAQLGGLMSKKPGGRGKCAGRRPRVSGKPPTSSGSPPTVAATVAEVDPVESDQEVWSSSRAGSRAGRGFHYQDVVGAWLCAQLLADDLLIERIVPEGFEDLSCEGTDAFQVQVKSRQERVGDFGLREVVDHILTMVRTRGRRDAPHERLFLVLERPIQGVETGKWGTVLADLPREHGLRAAVETELGTRDMSPTGINDIEASVGVWVLPWHRAAEQTKDMVLTRVSLPRAAAEPMVLALRDAVAACVDANTSPVFSERASLDRTKVEGIVANIAALVDVAALEEALRSGACEVIDFDAPLNCDVFYEGVDVQPGHIAAGLPAPRPALTGQVVDAVERSGVVLVSGPSGVGKSTVMWAAAYSTRHVLWYRVRRLDQADVEPIARLVLATGPTSMTPVGLVIDGVGQAGARAWDALNQRLAGVAGIVLLGSIRNEELLPLETLSRAVLIPVGLDEDVAEEIHRGLLERGATRLPHWRHAYDNARGLTLEFTHLLTRGQRLSDVITDQVRTRTRAGDRWLELRILGMVTTAHQWGASVGLTDVQQVLRAGDSEFRLALARLTEEHLVREVGATLTGMHQLRSTALSFAVHDQPPPLLPQTVRMLLPVLDSSSLAPFVVGALSAHPELDDVVISHLVDRLVAADAVQWIAALHTLRVVDFQRTAAAWVAICQRHGVPPALRQTLMALTIAGTEPLPNTRPEIAAAMQEITASPARSPLRDQLLTRLGPQKLAAVFTGCTDWEQAVQFLVLLDDVQEEKLRDFTALLRQQEPILTSVLQLLPLEELGVLLGAARSTYPALAVLLMEAAGGTNRLLNDIYAATPWLIELRTEHQAETTVAHARLLHVGEELVGDITAAVASLGTLLARCFAHCEEVDVAAVYPGGTPVMLNEDLPVAQRFLATRRIGSASTGWNRLRIQIATLAAGAADPTLRVQQARDLVTALADYLNVLTGMFLIGDTSPDTRARFVDSVADLTSRADNLTLSTEDNDIPLTPGAVAPYRTDAVAWLASAIVSNLTSRLATEQPHWASLAAFVGDSLRQGVEEVRTNEHWYLIDTDVPMDLDRLDTMLIDLHAVLAEFAWGSSRTSVIAAARTLRGRRNPLRTAARAANASAHNRATNVRREYRRLLKGMGIRASFVDRTPEDVKSHEWPPLRTAILVDVTSFHDWIHAFDTMQRLLGNTIKHDQLGLQPLFMPRVAGKPIAAAATYLSTTILPDPGVLFPQWRDLLNQPLPTPLTDTALSALKAIRTTSALRTLHACRPDNHGGEAAIRHQVGLVREALSQLDTFPANDPVVTTVTDHLHSLVSKVQSELDDTGATLQTSTIATELAQPASETHIKAALISILTLSWSISPANANEYLTSLQ